MTVSTETPITSAVANGVTTVFPYAYTVLEAGDQVVQGTLADVTSVYQLGVHYTLAGLGTASGSATFLSAPAAGTVITQYRSSTLQRLTDYQDNGDLLAPTLNRDIDRVWLAIQEIVTGGKAPPGSLRVPNGEVVPALPRRSQRANTILAFDANGDPTVSVPVSGSAADVLLRLADTTTGAGDALLAVKLNDIGAAAITQHEVNAAEPKNPKLHFASPWDNVTSSAVGLQNAVNAALAGNGQVYLPEGPSIRIDASIELNDAAASGAYRAGIKVLGAGQQRTLLLNRIPGGGPLFRSRLTQAQGDANSFSRGFEIGHLGIIADGGTSAGAIGLSLEGTYMPWLHDLYLSGLTNNIDIPSDARWPDVSDRHSCAEVTIERCNILSAIQYGIRCQAFATAVKAFNNFVANNAYGGYYLEGSNHLIDGGAVAGNGTSGLATSAGVYIARSTEGTPQNCRIHNVEFDGNWVNHIRTNGMNGLISRNRFIDAVVAGAFRAPVAVRVVALVGQSADSNLIEYNAFRFDAQAAVNVTGIQFDLDVNDGRTVRYNRARSNTMQPNGATSGVVTEVSYGTNPNVSGSFGNRGYTNALPEGTVVVGSVSKNLTDASTTQVVTGLGFRPVEIELNGFSGAMKSEGYADCSTLSPSNRGVYYYPTGAAWSDTGTNNALTFRTAAGDQQDGYVSATSDDGFTITWTKSGAPTGTATIKFVARR